MIDRQPSQATRPAFEVISPDGQTYRIWANGRTEGFGDDLKVINRLPALINGKVAAVMSR